MRVRSKTEATVRHFAVIIGLPLEFCCDNWPPARKNGVSFSRNELPLGAVPQSWPPARPPEAPRGLPRPPEARLVTQLLLEIKGCQHLPKMWLPGSPPPGASRGLPRPPEPLKNNCFSCFVTFWPSKTIKNDHFVPYILQKLILGMHFPRKNEGSHDNGSDSTTVCCHNWRPARTLLC